MYSAFFFSVTTTTGSFFFTISAAINGCRFPSIGAMKIFAPARECSSDLFWATAWVNARARSAKTASNQRLMVSPFLGGDIGVKNE
jgi:hypothetical protein